MGLFFKEKERNMRGIKFLKTASILEIVIGLASLLMAWFIVGKGDFSDLLKEGFASQIFLSILLVYGIHIFEILAGVIGLTKSSKKSVFVLILGIILFGINLVEFFTFDNDMIAIIIHAVSLVVPYFYLHGAYMNLKG